MPIVDRITSILGKSRLSVKEELKNRSKLTAEEILIYNCGRDVDLGFGAVGNGVVRSDLRKALRLNKGTVQVRVEWQRRIIVPTNGIISWDTKTSALWLCIVLMLQ